MRTRTGKQWISVSHDDADTWMPAKPWTLASPEAPATLATIPDTGHWLAVCNPNVDPDAGHLGKRTPLVARVSADQGQTWSKPKALESDPVQTYAYTSIDFAGERVLLTYYVSDSGGGVSWKFKSVPISWLPKPPAPARLDRDNLLRYRGDGGILETASTVEQWQRRRDEVIA